MVDNLPRTVCSLISVRGYATLDLSIFLYAQGISTSSLELGTTPAWEMCKTDMKRKILLIDDYAEIPAALSAALSSEGYEVITAKNGREACERLREEHIDVALLDLKTPVKDGWDAFERLKATHPLLQIIVITARPDQYPTAIAAGAAAFMEKPLDLPLLLRTIDDLLIEPVEVRLSRLTARRPIARYLRTEV
jgi:two-component system response regulator (stage 0 sporulation protein F)